MKILCIPYTHTLSHISRPLSVARELVRRGHEVIFAGESPKVAFIQQEGFQVYPLHEPDPGELFGNIRAGKLRFVSDTEIERMIQADLAIYGETRPDVVLTDGRFSAPLSTHVAGLKHAAIVNVSSTEYRAVPYIPLFEKIPRWIAPRDSSVWKLLDRLNLSIEMLVFDSAVPSFCKLSRKYGTARKVTATNCLTGNDLTLLADIPEYFPTRNLPPDYRYVGPLTWKANLPTPSWWPPARSDGPLVYVTMGTTGIGDFFHKVHGLFEGAEMTAIVATGAQIEDLGNISGKVYLESFIDGDLAVESSDIVVCHGGNGTIYQALQHGRPVVCIPTIPDQMFNGRRVEALGVGKTLTWSEFTRSPATLLETIRYILQERSFFQNAKRLKSVLSTFTAAETSADLIESTFRSTPH